MISGNVGVVQKLSMSYLNIFCVHRFFVDLLHIAYNLVFANISKLLHSKLLKVIVAEAKALTLYRKTLPNNNNYMVGFRSKNKWKHLHCRYGWISLFLSTQNKEERNSSIHSKAKMCTMKSYFIPYPFKFHTLKRQGIDLLYFLISHRPSQLCMSNQNIFLAICILNMCCKSVSNIF